MEKDAKYVQVINDKHPNSLLHNSIFIATHE